MSAETNEVAVPWFRLRRAILALIFGFALPLPWPEVPLPAGLLIILVAAAGDTGDHNGVVLGGPVLLVAIIAWGLIFAAGLYVVTTLWLRFREWRRWE